MTGLPAVDALLSAVIERFEASFPGRIGSHYLFGSYSEGTAVAASDVDVAVVFRGGLAKAEAPRVAEITREFKALTPIHADVLAFDEATLLRDGHFRIANSRLQAGEDIRPRLPPQPLDAYLRKYTEAPWVYMGTTLGGIETLVFPLDYPDPAGEFFGYDQSGLHGIGEREISAYVAAVCWVATLLIGLTAGATVPSRSRAPTRYRELICDEWSELVESVYLHGNQRWGYRVPANAEERGMLRELCRRTLGFENHYLCTYRAYLLRQLSANDAGTRRQAAERLTHWVLYPDDEVAAALHHQGGS
jgi:predicted nucleotidyltransferase